MDMIAIRVPPESGARPVGGRRGDMGAVEIPVDIRPIFQYQSHRSLSTLMRLFTPFSLRFLRRRIDPLIALVIRSGALL